MKTILINEDSDINVGNFFIILAVGFQIGEDSDFIFSQTRITM